MEKQGNNHKNKAATFGKSVHQQRQRPLHLDSAVSLLHLLTDAVWLVNEAVIYSNS